MSEASAELRLRAHVRAMRRVDAAVRMSESAAAALAAGGVCLAAARWSGPAALDPEVWIASACAALFAALAWSLEHRSSTARVVRTLDRAEGLAGALVTAWERRPATRELGVLLARRTSARLAPRAGLRAMLPRSGVAYAAPLAALALLAFAEQRSQARTAAAAAELGLARVAELGAAIERLPATDPARPALLAALASARSELRAAAGDRGSQAALERRLDDLERRLAGAADPGGREPGRTAAGRPSGREPAPRPPASGERPEGSAAASVPEPRTAGSPGSAGPDALRASDPGDPNAGTSEIPAASGVEAAAGDGTIPGRGAVSGASPIRADGRSTDPPAAGPGPARESGVGLGRWWPARHDQVVARWIEIAASERQPSRATPSPPSPRD